MSRPHIVLASQEVWPFVQGGGIGRHVSELAALLADSADVTVLTSARWRPTYERMAGEGDPRLAAGVRYRWVQEPPADAAPFQTHFHRWSYDCWQAVRELAREQPIDLVEFDDYRGGGAVTINAKRGGAPAVAETTIAVRLHTSWEIARGLDRQPQDSIFARNLMALERVSLRFADRLLHPAEPVIDAYRRFYGARALAPAEVVPPAFIIPPAPGTAPPALDGLRLLCLGRLQRFKGTDRLVQAFSALPDDDVRLTLVGGDTDSSPVGGSMRAYVEHLAAGDPRVRFLGSAGRDELDALFDSHHAVVVASIFESFNYVVREALARNRPVLATPVGGIVAGFVEGRSGWLMRDSSTDAIAEGLRALNGRRDEIAALIAAGEPRATLEEAIDPDALVARYLALATDKRPGLGAIAPTPGRLPLRVVTALVVAVAGDGPVGATLDAVERLDDLEVEVVVVTDDALRVSVSQLGRLHALVTVPAGSGSLDAVRAGLEARVGDGPVLLVAAGDAPAPAFAAAALAALDSPAAPAYVTAHGTGRDPANAPLGNAIADLLADFDASGTIALVRPEALAAVPPGRDGQALFAGLAVHEAFGAVMPEPLAGRTRSRSHDADPVGRAAAAVLGGHEMWG